MASLPPQRHRGLRAPGAAPRGPGAEANRRQPRPGPGGSLPPHSPARPHIALLGPAGRRSMSPLGPAPSPRLEGAAPRDSRRRRGRHRLRWGGRSSPSGWRRRRGREATAGGDARSRAAAPGAALQRVPPRSAPRVIPAARRIGRRRALGRSRMAAPSGAASCEDFAEFQVTRAGRTGRAGPGRVGPGAAAAAAAPRACAPRAPAASGRAAPRERAPRARGHPAPGGRRDEAGREQGPACPSPSLSHAAAAGPGTSPSPQVPFPGRSSRGAGAPPAPPRRLKEREVHPGLRRCGHGPGPRGQGNRPVSPARNPRIS